MNKLDVKDIEKKREYAKKYYENNKEEISKISKKYYENHKDKLHQYYLNNKEKNKEKIKEYSKKYYQKNKEKIRLYQKNRLLKIKKKELNILDLPDEILDPIFNIRCNEIEDEISKIINELQVIYSMVKKKDNNCNIFIMIKVFFLNINENNYSKYEIKTIINYLYYKYEYLLFDITKNQLHNHILLHLDDYKSYYNYKYKVFYNDLNFIYRIFKDTNNNLYFKECNKNIYFKKNENNNRFNEYYYDNENNDNIEKNNENINEYYYYNKNNDIINISILELKKHQKSIKNNVNLFKNRFYNYSKKII